jgi:signal transduction histidine kinase
MKLSRRTVGVIIGLIVVARAGLGVGQTALLVNAWRQEEQAFRSNVMSALGAVSRRLLAREAITLAFQMDDSSGCDGDSVNVCVAGYSVLSSDTKIERMEAPYPARVSRLEPRDSVLVYTLEAPRRVQVQVRDRTTGELTILRDTYQEAGEHSLTVPDSLVRSEALYWTCRADSAMMLVELKEGSPTMSVPEGGVPVGSQIFIKSLVSRLKMGDEKPLQERLAGQNLDSLITTSLREAGVDLVYRYVVRTADDSLHFLQAGDDSTLFLLTEFKTPLFPSDLFAQQADLLVLFPDREAYLRGQMGPLVFPTVILMGIIVACFAFTIRTIIAQRKFSDLLVDFINNMTHEFKTPIATVQLACDAIRRDDVVTDPERVLRFNRMIEEETRRMRNQADKILQMAVLERGDYELKREPVDMHGIIAQAVQVLSLHVEKRGGRLSNQLHAARYVVNGDAVHLANVVHNLLDNANKYSPNAPSIAVETQDADNELKMSISDGGIGLSPEHQKLVFQRYFRVPSGNVHDVKGFGLGLSYVKLIVEAHGGWVTLTSKEGEGTRVDVYLPTLAVEER